MTPSKSACASLPSPRAVPAPSRRRLSASVTESAEDVVADLAGFFDAKAPPPRPIRTVTTRAGADVSAPPQGRPVGPGGPAPAVVKALPPPLPVPVRRAPAVPPPSPQVPRAPSAVAALPPPAPPPVPVAALTPDDLAVVASFRPRPSRRLVALAVAVLSAFVLGATLLQAVGGQRAPEIRGCVAAPVRATPGASAPAAQTAVPPSAATATLTARGDAPEPARLIAISAAPRVPKARWVELRGAAPPIPAAFAGALPAPGPPPVRPPPAAPMETAAPARTAHPAPGAARRMFGLED